MKEYVPLQKKFVSPHAILSTLYGRRKIKVSIGRE